MTDRALEILLKTSILIEDMKKQKAILDKQMKNLDAKIAEASAMTIRLKKEDVEPVMMFI